MKLTRRIATLLLALIMVLSVSATVFADGETYNITITGTSEGHTYEAYQIFSGDMADDGTLSNVVWGSGVTADGQTDLGNAATKAASLSTTADAEAFAEAVAPYLTSPTTSATVAEGATTCALTGLTPGYYLIKTSAVPTDSNSQPEVNGVYSQYIMHVVYVNADLEIKIKASVPPVGKTADDTVVSIGQTVTFTLTSALPEYVAAYETYTLSFKDALPVQGQQSLEFEAVTSVTVGSKTLTKDVDYTVSCLGNGELTITIENARSASINGQAGDVVTAIYTAKVADTAVIGDEGFKNGVLVQYSNNPYAQGYGMTTTNEVTLYTWSIPVYKYIEGTGGAKAPLEGAGFTLYADEACTEAITITKDASVTDSNLYRVDPDSTTEEITTDATGKFVIGGLAEGTYYLKETATPAGYNTADVVAITVAEDGTLTIPGEDGAAETVTEVAVLNQAGTTLPTTGGMGTTMIYIVGGILALAAVVLLIVKRRMSTAE